MNCWDGECENPAPYFVSNTNVTSLPDSLKWMAGSTLLYFFVIYLLEQKILVRLWLRFRPAPVTARVETTDELVEEEARAVSVELAEMAWNSKCEEKK